MKNKSLILAVAVGLTLTGASLALARTDVNQAPNDSSIWDSKQNPTNLPSDPGLVQGTVSAVDAQAQSITVNETATKNDRTFSVMNKDLLAGINPGDMVSVTPEANNVSAAQRIEKDAGPRP